MNVVVTPSRLAGSVRVPASKSAAHRALIAAALSDAPTTVRLGALNRDIEATIAVLRALGAGIARSGDAITVEPIPRCGNRLNCTNNPSVACGAAPDPKNRPPAVSPSAKPTSPKACRLGDSSPYTGEPTEMASLCKGRWHEVPEGLSGKSRRCKLQPDSAAPNAELDCGESGSTLRFMLPVVCALGVSARFVGHGRLPQRPNAALTDALRAHGAAIDADRLPMRVAGPIRGGEWTLPGDVSSQYITGLLFALPLLDADSAIILSSPLQSAAYVDMTLDALGQFGVTATATETGWRVPGGQRYRSPGMIDVEGDWSAAAFWLAANALGAHIRLEGLRDDTAQGDRAALWLMGQPLIDATHVPDLVPALAVAAASLPQKTVVTGAARLKLKESDRIRTTVDALRALGYRAEATPDGLIVEGGAPEPCADALRTVDGANDHRIVMAAAVAAAFADRPVRILGAEAVDKSYPDFFRDFEQLGGQCHVEHPGQ